MVKILDSQDLEKAVEHLRAGELVGFPTETVYGLGADASNSEAVEKIFEVKGRPVDHPLIVHIADADSAKLWVREFPEFAVKLADAFWPGPLTMVLNRNGRVAQEAVGGKPTIALRVPNHPVALQLLEAFDGGLAGPSANKFGKVSPTSARHVEADLGGDLKYVLDGGKCKVGVESTIISLAGDPTVLRLGGVSVAEIEATLGVEVIDGTTGESQAPGMMKSHYAPKASIKLMTLEEVSDSDFEVPEGVGVIAPITVDTPISWTMPADGAGYARGLYAVLREADYRKVKNLIVVGPTEGEMIDAVLDRLVKASTPKL